MIRNKIFNSFLKQQLCASRNLSSQVNIEKLEQETSLSSNDFVSDEVKLLEEKIEQSRNKSRLREQDRLILMDRNPYPEPKMFHHGTLKYLRRTYGRYGEASGINPSICWPIKEELNDSKEYESIKYPFTIPDMIAKASKLKKEREERIIARQEEIVKKMEKLEDWKQELYNKIAKKEAEANAAKQKKERLIEEVKRHFGYSVDPKDEKFKEMLEKKEKEQRKALKEQKRKQKEKLMMDKLLKINENKISTESSEGEVTINNKIEKDATIKEE